MDYGTGWFARHGSKDAYGMEVGCFFHHWDLRTSSGVVCGRNLVLQAQRLPRVNAGLKHHFTMLSDPIIENHRSFSCRYNFVII